MKLVLDASAAVAVTLRQPGYEPLAHAIERFDEIIAPELFQSEVANTLWKYVIFSDLRYEYAAELLEEALGMVDYFVAASENTTEAFFEAENHKHTVYDLMYLTLARRNNAALITLDKKLAALAAKLGIGIYYDAGDA